MRRTAGEATRLFRDADCDAASGIIVADVFLESDVVEAS